MTEEIQRAVEAGKLNKRDGEALAKLQPGTIVQHKSWGYGAIVGHDFLLGQTTIDFRSKKGHSMQLEYAAESLTALASDHIGARKFADLDGLKTLAKNDGAALVRIVLASLGGRATQEQIAQQLVPDLFAEPAHKKWWEATKKLLKADPLIGVPQKKTEPFILREDEISQTDEVLAAFRAARTLKDQILALDNLTKALDSFKDPSVLQPVVSAIELAAKKAAKLETAKTLQLLVVRDEICAAFPAFAQNPDVPTVAGILRAHENRLGTLLGDLPAAKLKKAILVMPEAFSDHWAAKTTSIFMTGNNRVAPEAARLLIEKGRMDEFGMALDRAIRDQSISAEGLHWLGGERHGPLGEIAQTPRVFNAMIAAMERDQFKDKKDRRLHDLIMNDKDLIGDLLAIADDDERREVMRKLMTTPIFEELNKRSLLGRLVRLDPDLEGLITGKEDKPKTELIVSWASLERKKEEYDDLVNKKIPQNRQDIQIAHGYGDLRENFEYKSAKDQQRILMRQKSEAERDMARARGTDFSDAKTDAVAIGTTVKVRHINGGTEDTYTILGAWDTDPTKHIISYLSGMAQALIGKAVGEKVSVPTETAVHDVEIVSITRWAPPKVG